MARAATLQSDFSGGEISPNFQGRVDSPRYRTGLDLCKNWIPTPQGSLVRRPGTQFVSQTKFTNKNTRVVAFRFSSTQNYIIEFGHLYCRFYKDNQLLYEGAKNITGITRANPAVVTSNAHGYSNGDRVYITGVGGMTQVNDLNYTVAGVTANTYQLQGIDSSAYSAYTAGGVSYRLYEVVTPYDSADIYNLKFCQSADSLFIVHPSYQPRYLARAGDTSWTLNLISFLDGPYLDLNTTATTINPSGTTGSITLTASAALFASTDVGRVVRIISGTNWAWLRITAFTDSTHVTALVSGSVATTVGATVTWRLGLWSTTTGWPVCIVFHEDRLWLFGSDARPQGANGSVTGDYFNHAPTQTNGDVVATNAISVVINAYEINRIRNAISDKQGLQVFTSGTEFLLNSGTTGAPMTPTNLSAKQQSAYGCANTIPVRIGNASIYIQNTGRIVREMLWDFYGDSFKSTDITLLAEHITRGTIISSGTYVTGIVEMAVAKTPYPIIWCARADGVLVGLTYSRDQELKAGWHQHELGGYGDPNGGPPQISSVAVIPSSDGTFDQLWLVAERYINGGVVQYVESMSAFFEKGDYEHNAHFLDAHGQLQPTNEIIAITQANPAVMTLSATPGVSTGNRFSLGEIFGMTELNDKVFVAGTVAGNTVVLKNPDGSNVDSTAYDQYFGGGVVCRQYTFITGVSWLNGETITVFGDNGVQTGPCGANTLFLNEAAGFIVFGFPYNSDFRLLRSDSGAADGTALAKTRRANRVGILVNQTQALKFGYSLDDLHTVVMRTAQDNLGFGPPLFDGIVSEIANQDYDFDGQICFRVSDPYPASVLAISMQLTVEDRG